MNDISLTSKGLQAVQLIPNRGTKNLLKVGMKILVSVGLMYWILQDTDLTKVFHSVKETSWSFLLIALIFPWVAIVISVTRWRILLKAQGINGTFSFLVKSFLIGTFFNNILPSTIGGDISRIYDSWRLGATKVVAGTVIFVDRLLGAFSLMVIALVSFIFSNQGIAYIPFLHLWIIGGTALVFLCVWVMFFPNFLSITLFKRFGLVCPKKFELAFEKVFSGLRAFQGRRDTLGKSLALSFILQASVVCYYYFVSLALHLQVPLVAFFLIIPVTLFIIMIPVSINGIGLREGAFVVFFASWGVSGPEALALAWISYCGLLSVGLQGGILYALRR